MGDKNVPPTNRLFKSPLQTTVFLTSVSTRCYEEPMSKARFYSLFLPVLLVALVAPGILPAQDREWISYGGDPGGMQYSSLDQINRGNVSRLMEAWIYDTGELQRRLRAAHLLLLPDHALDGGRRPLRLHRLSSPPGARS